MRVLMVMSGMFVIAGGMFAVVFSDVGFSWAWGMIPFLLVFSSLPVLYAVVSSGRKRIWRVGLGLLALSLFAYGVESLSVATGFPYGFFKYGDRLGALIVGLSVPWILPFAWLPIVVFGYMLSRLFGLVGWRGWLVGVGAVVLVDIVVDPGAVVLRLWEWEVVAGSFSEGWYGVPWMNFAGWVLSGGVGVGVMKWMLDGAVLRGWRVVMIAQAASLLFWIGVGIQMDFLGVVVVGCCLAWVVVGLAAGGKMGGVHE